MKTSLDQAKSIQISSLRQLDTQGIKKLFLAHLRLTPHSGGKGGMTLPEYVEAVREKLPEPVVNVFNEKLHKSQLDENGKGSRY